MKQFYRITGKQGQFICWQMATSAAEALETARMYQRGCYRAESPEE